MILLPDYRYKCCYVFPEKLKAKKTKGTETR